MARATVLIIIDALGDGLASRHGFSPPGLEGRSRVKTVLGFSQAALTTIMTGATPAVHGMWMMYAFAGKRSPFRLLKTLGRLGSTERLYVRRTLHRYIQRVLKVSSYYDLYDVPSGILSFLDIPAKRQLFLPGGGGNAKTLIDDALSRGVPVRVWHYDTPEKTAFDELEEDIKSGKDGFFLLYTAGLDATMHSEGTMSQSTAERLAWYSERIGRIAAAGSDARIFVMGDHGMCDVVKTEDVKNLIEPLGLKIPRDYVPFYDSTMARFRVFDARAGADLESALKEISAGSVLDERDKKTLGIYFPDGRFGDVIFLAHAGTLIIPSYMGKKPIAAMHGYHPDEECMYSALFTNTDEPGPELPLTGVAQVVDPDFRGNGSRS